MPCATYGQSTYAALSRPSMEGNRRRHTDGAGFSGRKGGSSLYRRMAEWRNPFSAPCLGGSRCTHICFRTGSDNMHDHFAELLSDKGVTPHNAKRSRES